MSQPEDAPPVLEEELEEGDRCLEAADREEALMHAARALAVEPSSPRALAFADRVLSAMPDALDHLSMDEEVPFGIIAMRARALATVRRYVDAADLALQLGAFRPQLAYVPWALEFLAARPDLSTTDAERLIARAPAVYEALKKAPLASMPTRVNSEALCELMGKLQPIATSKSKASYLRSALLRRLGRPAEAVKEARRAFANEPTWLSAIELGLAHRDAGNIDEALAMLKRAAQLDPTDETAWLEIGDIQLNRSSFGDACVAFEEAMKRRPDDRHAQLGHARARAGSSGLRSE
jgi:tetratricopeptide (TPR) repeat protein